MRQGGRGKELRGGKKGKGGRQVVREGKGRRAGSVSV